MNRWLLTSSLLLISATATADTNFEVSGKVAAELRAFPKNSIHSGQYGNGNAALTVEPEFYWDWNESNDSLLFKPFLRLDQHDSERTHADVRELLWTHVNDDWEIKAGLGKVFWGVTEFQHLVDIVNQADGVEDIDGEDKLGQPMIALSLVREWGIFDLLLLPGFRERTFPGEDGRLRSSLVVDTERTTYESAAKQHHTDIVARWSHTIGNYDFGLYWFRGTSRDPLLSLGLDKTGSPVLTPHYEQINQTGLDWQATLDDWLLKLEVTWRDGNSGEYWAAQGGFEYTFTGVRDTSADLGLLMEYGWDERGTSGTSTNQNDLFFGARLALNDAASSELLAGVSYDLDHQSKSLFVEASRRIGENWKISLDARFFSSTEPSQPIYSLRQDDHAQLTLEYYF